MTIPATKGKIIRSSKQLSEGEEIETFFSDGKTYSKVTEVEEGT